MLPALNSLNSFPSGQGSRRMKFGIALSSCPSCCARTEPRTGRTNGWRGSAPRLRRLMPCACSLGLVDIERTTASLSMIDAHLGISELICTPGTFVEIARKGPPESVPGLGSHVSNWLGAPVNHSRMQCFCSLLACSANVGTENNPAQLPTEIAPAPASPLRNMRRCSVCSGVGHSPAACLDRCFSFTVKPCGKAGSVIQQKFGAGEQGPGQLANTCFGAIIARIEKRNGIRQFSVLGLTTEDFSERHFSPFFVVRKLEQSVRLISVDRLE